MTVQQHSIADMAADYKSRGMDKFRAWDQYIIDMWLKPEINAGEFYDIFNTVTAKSLAPVYERPEGFDATHYDKLLQKDCMITLGRDGVWSIVWENGHTGTYPPCNPPELGRYVKKVTL